MTTVVFSVAEPSGDRLAARLLEALQAEGPVLARGVVGPALRAAGCAGVARVEDIAAMGLGPVLRRLPAILAARRALVRALDGADALVCVDAPDFHGPVIRAARARGIPVIGYVSPQVWAWRRDRIDDICADHDALLCLFRFEPPLYAEAAARHRCAVSWVGHPSADRLRERDPADRDRRSFGLLPSSRPAELARHLPVFLEVARRVRISTPDARFLLPLSDELAENTGPLPEWVQRVPAGTEQLARCRTVLTKSGTSTLELALLGVPQVVAHRVDPLTWAVGSRLVRGVRHLALPNILAGREVVPEHRQDLDPAALARDLLALPEVQPTDVREQTGDGGASARAAAAVRQAIAAGPKAAAATSWWPALAVLLTGLAVRLLVGHTLELAEDEAYYWTWARDLAWGYFDHPPAVAAMIRGGTALLGDTELGVRLLGGLLGLVTGLAAVDLTKQRGLAALALTTLPLTALGGVLATPDVPLVAAWTLGLWAAARRNWPLVGVFAGLAMLSKYTGVLLLPLLVLGAGPRAWRRPGPWIAASVAGLVYAPNAAWNLGHELVSWRFQLEHVRESADRLGFLAAQFGLAGPVLFGAGLVWAARAWRTTDPVSRLTWWSSLPLLGIAVLAGGEANWAAPAVVGLVIGLARRGGAWTRALSIGAGLNLALSALVLVHTAWRPLLDLPVDPRDRLSGGRILGDSVKAWGIEPVLTSRYQEAALIAFYGGVEARTLPGHSRPDQYDLLPWEPPEHALFVRTWRGLQGTPTDQRGYDRSGPNTVTAYVPTTDPLVPRPVARWQVFELWIKTGEDAPAPWPGGPAGVQE
jgi:lipid-A-disaccharide synthase